MGIKVRELVVGALVGAGCVAVTMSKKLKASEEANEKLKEATKGFKDSANEFGKAVGDVLGETASNIKEEGIKAYEYAANMVKEVNEQIKEKVEQAEEEQAEQTKEEQNEEEQEQAEEEQDEKENNKKEQFKNFED